MTVLLVDAPHGERPSLFDADALGGPAETARERAGQAAAPPEPASPPPEPASPPPEPAAAPHDLGRRTAAGPRPTRAAGLTLETLVSGAWEGLVARRSVACPVCGGAMAPSAGSGALTAPGGRCRDCGATLV